MGKWAQYAKRGAGTNNLISPPVAAQFTIGTVTATSIEVLFSGSVPPQAGVWRARAINNTTGSLTGAITGGASGVIPGLTTATTYRIAVEWLGIGVYSNIPVSQLIQIALQTTA